MLQKVRLICHVRDVSKALDSWPWASGRLPGSFYFCESLAYSLSKLNHLGAIQYVFSAWNPLPSSVYRNPTYPQMPPLLSTPGSILQWNYFFTYPPSTLHRSPLRVGAGVWISLLCFSSVQQHVWTLVGIRVIFDKWKKEWMTKSLITSPTRAPFWTVLSLYYSSAYWNSSIWSVSLGLQIRMKAKHSFYS